MPPDHAPSDLRSVDHRDRCARRKAAGRPEPDDEMAWKIAGCWLLGVGCEGRDLCGVAGIFCQLSVASCQLPEAGGASSLCSSKRSLCLCGLHLLSAATIDT